MNLLRPTFVTIHLDRLMENFRRLKSLNPEQDFICPMIKANAYGHGDVAVAKALVKEDCKHLGVSSVEEGLNLRQHHVTQDILVFGFYGRESVSEIIAQSLTPVVSNFDHLSDLCLLAKKEIKIHLKFDTGMHRLGFQIHEVPGILNVLAKNPSLKVEGICTHFHSGHEITEENSSAWLQNLYFSQIIDHFKGTNAFIHAYNSAAIASLHKKRARFDYGFRPGLLAYGIDPGENLSIKPLVSPVMEFKSKIVCTQQVKSGEVVSYGGVWRADKDSLIGIVPAGYADGVCRSLSDSGEFLVRGQRVPIRGRVCMDYTMVDLTELKNSSENLINEEVVLIGAQGSEQIDVEDVAESAGRVTYEVMTGISERVPRIYGVNG